MQSVNSETVKQAPAEATIQLGQFLQRLVVALAYNYDENTPFKFKKLDIKYGFWRQAVSDTDACNLCYVIPQFKKVKIEYIEVVVPNCLQMGCCESPPFFCAASETARDIIDTILLEVNLPQHPFEEQMIAYKTENPRHRLKASVTYINLVKLFVDNFMAATNNPSLSHLTHLSRAMLHGFYSIFPPQRLLNSKTKT